MTPPTCSLPATATTRECRQSAVYRFHLERTVLVAYSCANHRDVILEATQRAALYAGDHLVMDRLAWQPVPLAARTPNGR